MPSPSRIGRKVYVAAAFARGREMVRVARDLREAGYDVVSSWIEEAGGLAAVEAAGDDTATAALRDLRELRGADLCIMFSTPVGKRESGRGGRHVELGAAIAWELPVILVGPDEHVFHALATAKYASWPDCLDALIRERPSLAA